MCKKMWYESPGIYLSSLSDCDHSNFLKNLIISHFKIIAGQWFSKIIKK